MLNRTNIFNTLLVPIILILISMSLLAIIAIHWSFFNTTKYSFSFSPTGINNYLNGFGNYKALFTSTVATIAAYFGLFRLKAATDANRDKLKQDRFSEWKTVLDVRFIEMEKKDPCMKREFIKLRYNYFNQLYNMHFSISNKDQLQQIFQTNFNASISFFEIQNNKYVSVGGYYPDHNFSYSFDSFQFLVLGSIDNDYPKILDDLRHLYLEALGTDRIVSMEMYKLALLRNSTTS